MQSLPPERLRSLRTACPTFRRSLSGGLVVALVLCSHVARADETPWVSILAGPRLSSEAADTLDRLAVELERSTGIHLLSPAQTAAAFEHEHSQPATTLSPTQLQTVDQAVRIAMQRAAVGEWQQVEAQLTPLTSLDPAARDYAVWRLELTRDLFDLCTMRAGWLLNSAHAPEAKDQLARCIVEAPAHPGNPEYLAPELRPLYDQAREAVFAQGHAVLRVLLAEGAALASPCEVLINGAPRPLADGLRYELPAGLSLRVAVHCRDLGRVHSVTVRPGDNQLAVDPELEQVILTDDVMALHSYGEWGPPGRRYRIARAVARILTAAGALLIGASASGQLALERVLSKNNEVAHVVLDEGASADDIRVAAHALTSRQPTAPAPSSPQEPRAPPVELAASTDAPPPWLLIAGTTAAASGIAGYVVAWMYLDLALQYRDPITRGETRYLSDYDTARDRALLLSVAGAALVTLSAPLLLPDYESTPAIPWIAGGTGALAAVIGTYLAASGQTCTSQACVADRTDATIGTLVILTSLPLISVTLTYLARGLLNERAELQVRAQRGTVHLSLSGEL